MALSGTSEKFIGIATLAALSNNEVITDLFPKNPSGGLEHVKLSFEIDFILVLPATANIICKAANGVADDLISTTLSICEQPTIYAPAMNFRMWQNEATIKAVKDLQKRGKIIINPDEGKLASLHSGEGRLANTDKIISENRGNLDNIINSLATLPLPDLIGDTKNVYYCKLAIERKEELARQKNLVDPKIIKRELSKITKEKNFAYKRKKEYNIKNGIKPWEK